MARYIFGGDTGMTPEQVRRQRELANLIRGKTPAPKNWGEGLNAIAGGLVSRWHEDAANEAETTGRAGATEAFSRLVSGITGGAPGYTPSGGALAAANDVAGASVAEGRSLPPHIGPTQDTMAYRDAIASIESAGSGDYAAVGPTHPELGRALGRYQVMEANIGPWSRQVLGREVTPEEFMANPEIQDAIFDGIFGQYVEKFGPEGAAQAWFAGPGGVGKMDRSDSLGTTVSAYTDKFNTALGGSGGQRTQVASLNPGAGMEVLGNVTPDRSPNTVPWDHPGALLDVPQEPAPQPAPAPTAQAPQQPPQAAPAPIQPRQQVAQGPSLEELLMVSQNPWLTDSQRSALNTMIDHQLKQRDPRYQQQLQQGDVDLRRSEFELDQMMNAEPDPWSGLEIINNQVVAMGPDGQPVSLGDFGSPETTAAMQNYQFLLDQGVDPNTAMERAFSGGVNVNLGDSGPKLGSLSTDYGYMLDDDGQPIIDPETRLPMAAPVPGSPAARAIEEERAQAESRQNQTATQAGTVTQDAGIALQAIGELQGLSADDGPLGANIRRAQAGIAGTPEYRIQRFVNSALANVGFDQLNQMRQNSPTGGALGNVTELQLRQLESVLGQYDIGLPLEDQKFILQRISNIYSDIIFGSRAERDQAVREGKMTQEEADRYDRYYYPETRDPMGRPIDQPSEPGQSQANPDIFNGTTDSGVTWRIIE